MSDRDGNEDTQTQRSKARKAMPWAQARVYLEAIAKNRGLEGDEHVLLMRELIDANDANDASERAERIHLANNALAGVLANLDFVGLMLRGASPEQPILATASREDRANVLTAIGHALSAAGRLGEIIRSRE